MAKGRQLALQVVHYLRKEVVFNGPSTVVTVGTLPVGAVVTGGMINVSQPFNAGTGNTADVGITGAPQGFAAALALGSVGSKPLGALATSASLGPNAQEVDVIATLTVGGSAATTGRAQVIVQFTVNNDG